MKKPKATRAKTKSTRRSLFSMKYLRGRSGAEEQSIPLASCTLERSGKPRVACHRCARLFSPPPVFLPAGCTPAGRWRQALICHLKWKAGTIFSSKMFPVSSTVNLPSLPRGWFIDCGTTSFKQFAVQSRKANESVNSGGLGAFWSWLVCTAVYRWYPGVKLRIHLCGNSADDRFAPGKLTRAQALRHAAEPQR
jgi:hypothetical protein